MPDHIEYLHYVFDLHSSYGVLKKEAAAALPFAPGAAARHKSNVTSRLQWCAGTYTLGLM